MTANTWYFSFFFLAFCSLAINRSSCKASAGFDKQICIWDVATKSHFHTFTQHRKAVTSLCFQHAADSYVLYSGSEDLTVKVWQVAEKSYVETLYSSLMIPNNELERNTQKRGIDLAIKKRYLVCTRLPKSVVLVRVHVTEVCGIGRFRKKVNWCSAPASKGKGVVLPLA